MAIPLLGGLIWRSEWHTLGEGPYSTAAKIIHANCLRPSYFRDALHWKYPDGPNLLCPAIHQRSENLAIPIERLITDSSIHRLAPNIYDQLAGSQALRYCQACMTTGFQATIAQIDGLDLCPIHCEPHRSSCIRCGARTPRYHLGNNEGLPRFSCWKCHAPFGSGGLIEAKFDVWAPPNDLHRLDPIHRWLSKINDRSSIIWPSLANWDSTKFIEDECEAHRREAVFSVFTTLVSGLSFSKRQFEPKITFFGPFQISLVRRPKDVCEVAFPGGSASDFDDYRDSFRTPSFGVPVPVDPMVPLRIHAQQIWRAQFSEYLRCRRADHLPLTHNVVAEILGEQKFWFELGSINNTFKLGIVAAAWLTAERIAAEWQRILVGLSSKPRTQRDEAWITACNHWEHRLGCWRYYEYFPVAAIVIRAASSEEPEVYLAVA